MPVTGTPPPSPGTASLIKVTKLRSGHGSDQSADGYFSLVVPAGLFTNITDTHVLERKLLDLFDSVCTGFNRCHEGTELTVDVLNEAFGRLSCGDELLLQLYNKLFVRRSEIFHLGDVSQRAMHTTVSANALLVHDLVWKFFVTALLSPTKVTIYAKVIILRQLLQYRNHNYGNQMNELINQIIVHLNSVALTCARLDKCCDTVNMLCTLNVPDIYSTVNVPAIIQELLAHILHHIKAVPASIGTMVAVLTCAYNWRTSDIISASLLQFITEVETQLITAIQAISEIHAIDAGMLWLLEPPASQELNSTVMQYCYKMCTDISKLFNLRKSYPAVFTRCTSLFPDTQSLNDLLELFLTKLGKTKKSTPINKIPLISVVELLVNIKPHTIQRLMTYEQIDGLLVAATEKFDIPALSGEMIGLLCCIAPYFPRFVANTIMSKHDDVPMTLVHILQQLPIGATLEDWVRCDSLLAAWAKSHGTKLITLLLGTKDIVLANRLIDIFPQLFAQSISHLCVNGLLMNMNMNMLSTTLDGYIQSVRESYNSSARVPVSVDGEASYNCLATLLKFALLRGNLDVLPYMNDMHEFFAQDKVVHPETMAAACDRVYFANTKLQEVLIEYFKYRLLTGTHVVPDEYRESLKQAIQDKNVQVQLWDNGDCTLVCHTLCVIIRPANSGVHAFIVTPFSGNNVAW